jgi:trimeric autotransporter adhesin
VIVNPLPTASIAGTTSVCLNSVPPLITFTGASASAPYTFTYNINGGANQQITTISGNSVTIAAPTNALGTFTYNLVSVRDGSSTACFQAQAGSATVTVNLLPTATVSGTTAVCYNGTPPLVTFTGASTSPPYTFTYNINGGASQFVTTTSGSSVSIPAPTGTVGTYSYNLLFVQDGSLYTCSQAQSGIATITVNPLPTASISGNNSVCRNSASPLITFTGASSTAPYTFTYNINGGASQFVTTTSGNSVTVAAPTNIAGTFTYNLLSVQDGSLTSCSQAQSGSATVTVAPLPTATVSGTTSVCLNSPPPLITFTGATSTAPYSFTYNINGGANQVITTTSGSSVTVAAPTGSLGTFTYNLVSVQDGSGLACSQAQTGSATVTVNLLPTATVSGTTSVCLNAASPLVTFTGASTSPPYTFTYNINGGASQFITTSSGNSVTVAAPTNIAGTFSYNLLFVQDGSPTTCQQAQSGTATIVVNQLPTASITGTTSVCQNSAAPLIIFTGGTTSPPYTFTYNINGGANQTVTTLSGNSASVSAPTGVVGSFIYNLVSVQDGTPQTCSQVQNGSATVLVTSLPTATVSGTTAVCLNSTAPLITFTGASAIAPYTFTYKINGGANQVISTTSGNSVTVAAPTNVLGTFTYSLVCVQDGSALGCSQSWAGSASVTINPLPYVNLTVCNDLITTTTSRTFTLKGGLPPGGQYYIDGVPAAGGLFNPTVLSASNHQITYSFTDFNTCTSNSSSVFINVISGSPAGSCPLTFTDPRDNYLYKAFTIGSHCWMTTNLNYGNTMASAAQVQSDNCTPEKYCFASDAGCTTYGGLYQWDELMQYQVPASGLTVQGMCPPEWHIPTQAEWTDLINSVTSTTPGDGLGGSYLKDPVPTFGFHTLLDGLFYQNNTWTFISGNFMATMFWTSTTDGPFRSIARGMNTYTYSVSFYPSLKSNAFSVRCVKD